MVESNVYFPTDYNLLWDSARKCLDMIGKFQAKYPWIPGWRMKQDWYRQLKNAMRAVGKATLSGGKGKEQRVKRSVRYYLTKARALQEKLLESKLPMMDEMDMLLLHALPQVHGIFGKVHRLT